MGEARRKIIKQNTAQVNIHTHTHTPERETIARQFTCFDGFSQYFRKQQKRNSPRVVQLCSPCICSWCGCLFCVANSPPQSNGTEKKLKKCTIRTSHRLLLKMLSGNSKKAEKRKFPKSLRRWWFDFLCFVFCLFSSSSLWAIGCMFGPHYMRFRRPLNALGFFSLRSCVCWRNYRIDYSQ